MQNQKFHKGQRVRIIKGLYGHYYKIGQVVKITGIDQDDPKIPYITLGKGKMFWVSDKEIEPYSLFADLLSNWKVIVGMILKWLNVIALIAILIFSIKNHDPYIFFACAIWTTV
ncbi:MAG: hypothetical protein AAF620_15255 [Bacteroidota bacterium]